MHQPAMWSRCVRTIANRPSATSSLFKPRNFTCKSQTPSVRAYTITSGTRQVKRPLTKTSSPRVSLTHRTLRNEATSTVSASGASSASHASSTAKPAPALTWNRFLEIRKTRRRISLVSSIVCAGVTVVAGLNVITNSDYDSYLASTFGLDPVAVLGISTAGLAVIGWLIGPAFGNRVFAVIYRGRVRTDFVQKEREFYARIKAHRVDPANSSIQNPVPDYYGEKIGSVAGYRKWLKDQRAFNLKRERGLRAK